MNSSIAWNPSLGSDCSGLYDGWWVCISVRPASVSVDLGWTTTQGTVDIPTITANYTPTSFPPIDPSFTASPTQNGVVSGCKSFYQAKAVSFFSLSFTNPLFPYLHPVMAHLV